MSKKQNAKLPAYHFTVQEGIEFAMNAYYSEWGGNLSEVFYDTEKKVCLALDILHNGDVSDEEERLIEIVTKEPARFIKFPTFSSRRVYNLMRDFSEECDSEPLKRALEGAKPMATFKIVADRCDLLDRWYAYEYEKKENFFKRFLERHEIKVF